MLDATNAADTLGELRPDPAEAPILPLGHCGSVYYVLTGQGELRSCSARDLEGGRGVFDLFVGAKHNDLPVEQWLAAFFEPKRERKPSDADPWPWNRQAAGEWVMRACVSAGLFDPATPVRSLGVWRSPKGAVAHCGEHLLDGAGGVQHAGTRLAEAVYPSVPGGSFPKRFPLVEIDDGARTDVASADEIHDVFDRVRTLWGWRRPHDADAWLGWIGAAALGAFPEWRPHLWVSGRRGSGKSELVQVGSSMLGPMSPGVWNDFSAAGIRQTANGQARPHLFDEAERDANPGKIEAVIEMFRTMSGDTGAKAVRGQASHTAVTFTLYGAGYLSSILPGRLEPQDRSRFVMLELDQIPKSDDPAAAAIRLAKLREDASRLGPRLWRRALERSADWDATFNAYRALVQTLGGEPRDGATIGAILAGFDLLTYEGPPDENRLRAAEQMAQPLIDDARSATEEGEGELCLRRLLQSTVNLGGGEVRSIGELVERGLRGSDENRKLGRFGLRVRTASSGVEPALLVTPGVHRQLDMLFQQTRWADGGHRQAVMMLAGVEQSRKAVRIAGLACKPLVIPRAYLPELPEEDREK